VLTLDVNSEGPVLAEVAAYRHILHRIRLGELGAGARVRTGEIAIAIGLSRQPVREAIRRLEAEGYLTSRPNCGAMVSKYTAEQLSEMFEIRTALECLAVGIATPQLKPEDFSRLEQLIDAMAAAGDETNTWLVRHTDFHLALVGMARRPRLAVEIARLHAALEPYMRLWFLHAGTPNDAREEHEQLLQALRSGYPKHAEDVLHDHVLATAAQIIPSLESISAVQQDGESDVQLHKLKPHATRRT
jgi:DNA-binding GntR family transcriptional regulator